MWQFSCKKIFPLSNYWIWILVYCFLYLDGIEEAPTLRDGWRYQNGWIFEKVPNGFWPPSSFLENHVAMLQTRGAEILDSDKKLKPWHRLLSRDIKISHDLQSFYWPLNAIHLRISKAMFPFICKYAKTTVFVVILAIHAKTIFFVANCQLRSQRKNWRHFLRLPKAWQLLPPWVSFKRGQVSWSCVVVLNKI